MPTEVGVFAGAAECDFTDQFTAVYVGTQKVWPPYYVVQRQYGIQWIIFSGNGATDGSNIIGASNPDILPIAPAGTGYSQIAWREEQPDFAGAIAGNSQASQNSNGRICVYSSTSDTSNSVSITDLNGLQQGGRQMVRAFHNKDDGDLLDEVYALVNPSGFTWTSEPGWTFESPETGVFWITPPRLLNEPVYAFANPFRTGGEGGSRYASVSDVDLPYVEVRTYQDGVLSGTNFSFGCKVGAA